ncbi:MAG: GGDEF domain-containing protein [Oleiphilaceae bacterium]|nr:GGDEF domain-containing protein [Oleiphilaceae bacterium]
MLVKEVMNSSPLCLVPETPVQEAVEALVDQQESCMLVVQNKRLLGIVTERDLSKLLASMMKAGGQGVLPRIGELMTPEPVCVDADNPCEDALMLSRTRNLRHLPVLDERDEVVGVVTQGNLLDAFARVLDEQMRLRDSLKEMQLLSLEDPLLGVGNRRAMEVDLNFTEAEARRHGKTYAVALIDIDFFKRYNDRYGHRAGDHALRQVAQTIKQTVRDSDRVFRYGGEEILVLMPETDIESARQCIERVREAIEHLQLANENTPLQILTVSGGVMACKEGAWQELVEAADKALYEAKNSGRNRVCVAETAQ